MTDSRFLTRLREHLATLRDVDRRYVRDRREYYPADGDIDRTKLTVLKLIDLFNEHESTKRHARMIQAAYQGGTNNFAGYPSLSCVRDLSHIVDAAITRIEDHPELLDPPQNTDVVVAPAEVDQPEANAIDFPAKVTWPWLRDNVPISLWLQFGAFVVATFVLGLVIGSTYPHLVTAVLNIFKQSSGG